MPRYISDRSILNPRRPVMPHLETLPPYLTRIVVGDLHGDLEGLRTLLAHLGVLDRFSKRCDGFHIAQLGDLIHGGHHEERADRQMLEEVLERGWLDEVLCGNHELYPAFKLPSGRWEGMTDPPDQKVVELLRQLRRRGGLTAASAVDGWLLTHAGLHPLYQKRVPAGLRMTAVDLATYLCAAFEARIRDRSGRDVFDAVGPVRSGGRDPLAGGIFWADASEMATAKTEEPGAPDLRSHPAGQRTGPTASGHVVRRRGRRSLGVGLRAGQEPPAVRLGARGGAVPGRPATAEAVMDSGAAVGVGQPAIHAVADRNGPPTNLGIQPSGAIRPGPVARAER